MVLPPPPLSGHPPLQEFSIRIHNCFLVYGDSRWRNPPSLEPDNEAPHFPPRRDLRTLPFECLPLAARSRDKRTGRRVESPEPRSAVLRSFVAIVNPISHIFLLHFFSFFLSLSLSNVVKRVVRLGRLVRIAMVSSWSREIELKRRRGRAHRAFS